MFYGLKYFILFVGVVTNNLMFFNHQYLRRYRFSKVLYERPLVLQSEFNSLFLVSYN